MTIVRGDDLLSLVAKYTGYNKEVVKDIMSAQSEVLITLLKNGYGARVPLLGTITLSTHKAREERQFKKPKDGEMVTLRATDEYQTPRFKFRDSLMKEFKELTEGNLL